MNTKYYIKNEKGKYLMSYDRLSTSWDSGCKDEYTRKFTFDEVVAAVRVMAESPVLYPSYTIEVA